MLSSESVKATLIFKRQRVRTETLHSDVESERCGSMRIETLIMRQNLPSKHTDCNETQLPKMTIGKYSGKDFIVHLAL
jgi:hypothetical protein